MFKYKAQGNKYVLDGDPKWEDVAAAKRPNSRGLLKIFNSPHFSLVLSRARFQHQIER